MERNHPALWQDHLPDLSQAAHKYERGHAIITGGDIATGAARLAARAALRGGAGLVSVLCSQAAFPIYAAALEAVMVRPDIAQPDLWLQDARITAWLHGPGAGISDATRALTLQMLAHSPCTVLDADALSSFEHQRDRLFSAMRAPAAPVIFTPHEGEFNRLFDPSPESKLTRTQQAARLSGAVIVHKGRETVIAAPDGRCTLHQGAPAALATAGTGDVLAGLITGLCAQGMPAFEAACAGVWLHSAAAESFGFARGLTASDLPDLLPVAFSTIP